MPTSAIPAALSYADADARLGGALSAVFEGAGASPGYGEALFFDGDLTLDGDFLDAINALRGGDEERDLELVVVTGDLTVNGPIALYADRPGLYVGGRTEAETLEGGEAEICIHDGAFTHLVYGWYNHGSLQAGIVDTPWVIDYDHDMELAAPGARWVNNYEEDEDADFAVGEGIIEAFVPEVVDAEDGSLLVDEFLDRLRAGLPVLRPGTGARSETESG
ncbi:hypothetical protein ABZW03_09230 [Kitasatospora sp. NPDC004799]|uniref:hypothetical protein n=1 Tax=Kitasatospora sp. NPDC004799 TaxID=3154460 RepID=UPI0033BC9C69